MILSKIFQKIIGHNNLFIWNGLSGKSQPPLNANDLEANPKSMKAFLQDS
jgi:hypothetical protein